MLGALAGFLCNYLATSSGEVAWPISANIIASRTLIGLAIGISALKLCHWSVHGLVMGVLFSVPLAFGTLIGPENPEFTKTAMFVWTIVLGMVYGLLIEFITTVLFKTKR